METLVNSNAMKVNLPDMNAYVYIREQNGEMMIFYLIP